MDGMPANLPLPPSPGNATFVPPGQPQPPPSAFAPPAAFAPQVPQPARGAVGRPSADPEQQEARAEKHQMKQRLKNLLPQEMTDGRIAVYKLDGLRGRNKSSAKPVMLVLFGELEKALAEDSTTSTGDYVREKIVEKFGEKGRFLWEAQDQKGRQMMEYGEAEINLNNTEPGENMDGENELLDETLTLPAEKPAFFRETPPPPPANFDAAAHAKQVQEIVRDEKRGAQDTMALMMTMMTNQTQMQLAQMERTRQEEERRREVEERRAEREADRERAREEKDAERRREEERRREKDEDTRRERERDSRKEMIALALPLISKLFEPKPDTTTPLLFKMLENKNGNDSTKELFTLMGEASRQNMAAQGEATKHLLNCQAEASKTVISNVMGISKNMMDNMLKNEAEPTDDPMEKVGRIFKMIAPALGALNQPAQVIPPQPQQQRIAQQPQAPAQPVAPPPAEYIKGGLYTIMRLGEGETAVQHRFNALKWCADNLPKSMLDAIRAGDEDKVIEIGAQGMDAKLVGWISDEANMEFLRGCIKDIQRMLLGAMTQVDAKESLEEHILHLQAKGITVPGAPAPAQAQAAEAEVVPPADDKDLAQPVEEKKGKRRAPPPADVPPAEAPAPAAPAAEEAQP